jgi:hypothetical protein
VPPIFYFNNLDTYWLFDSEKLFSLTSMNKKGKNYGKHTIKLDGKRSNKEYLLEVKGI